MTGRKEEVTGGAASSGREWVWARGRMADQAGPAGHIDDGGIARSSVCVSDVGEKGVGRTHVSYDQSLLTKESLSSCL